MSRICGILRLAAAAFAVCTGITAAPSAEAQIVRQITDVKTGWTGLGAPDDIGGIVTISAADPYGTNPQHKYQLFAWDPGTQTGEQLSSFEEGVAAEFVGHPEVSVSDDGQRLAFLSRGDLTGANADHSLELFVMQRDGTGLVQVTDATSPNDGLVKAFELSGNGSRVVFHSTANYLGNNPTHASLVYVVNADGSGLLQLDSGTAQGISDDGQRVLYAQGGGAIWGVQADGSNAHLLASPGFAPRISGDGSRVAYYGHWGAECYGASAIYAVDWDGTNDHIVAISFVGDVAPGAAGPPDLTDDGGELFYPMWGLPAFAWWIWKSGPNGEGWTNLTDEGDCVLVRVAGDGALAAFLCRYGPDLSDWNDAQSYTSHSANGDGTDVQELPRGTLGNSEDPDLTADGSRMVFASSANPLHEDPPPGPQMYRVAPDGSDPFRLTSFGGGAMKQPAITDDGTLVVFASNGNPLGSNPGGWFQIFAVGSDGTGLVQLTFGSSSTSPPAVPEGGCVYFVEPDSDTPDLAGDGSVVVFHSRADLTGENASGAHRLFRIAPDGSALAQLGGNTLEGQRPRVDGSGSWVVFDDGLSVRRIRTDGTGLQTLAPGSSPDISANGQRIVFESTISNGGSNPDLNQEIFLFEPKTGIQQLTFTTRGKNSNARLSADGEWVYFLSSSPYFETSHADTLDFFRLDVETKTVERVGALSPCDEGPLSVNQDGSLAVFSAGRDCAGKNPDDADELFVIDRNGHPDIFVSPGPEPTVVSWETASGPIRYDVIRGDLASLAVGGGIVDLGAVVCVEDDSVDADTVGSEDAGIPAPGQGFFYLQRGSIGAGAGPGSYGKGSAGDEREPSAGGCAG